jgi:non-specific serine/threonine protein kinase
MRVLRLHTFGGLSLRLEGTPLRDAAQQPRRLAVLAALAVAGERGLTRAKLLGLLWPEADETRGRQALSQALYALKRDCGTQPLEVVGEELHLDTSVITSDVADLVIAAARDDLDAVAALYVGPFLDGVHLNDTMSFERWVESQRAHFATIAQQAFERLAASAGRATVPRHAEQFGRTVRVELEAEPGRAAPLSARYTIEREIGRGGMAVVYLARDLRHDRPVALKMLNPDSSTALGRERLQREILITATLRHPHILPLFDSGESEGSIFYVMPFVDGESLRARLVREGPLPIDDAVRLAREVAEALHHAHVRAVIHRDVKPENILLSEGHAVVMDFGIARSLSPRATETLTQQGFGVGTPAYMSPEQITGDDDIGAPSDVYALGCVLFEMLTGRPPWIGTNARAVLTRRFIEDPPEVAVLRPDVAQPLASAIRRSLMRDPAERFESADSFSQALDRAMERPSASVRPPALTLPEPPGALVGREGEMAAAGALLARPDVRLLTLTGMGGTGKTRLAMRLAAEAQPHFEDGVRFVDLSAVTDSSLVFPTIAGALGIREMEGRSAHESIVAHVGGGRVLLVLDNLEQVASAAPDVARLVTACPQLTILATSRVRLRVRGEHEFFVSPLTVADLERLVSADDLRRNPAVELFLHRATEAREDLEVGDDDVRAIAKICLRLDGLPLAIELAAARCRILSPSAVLARLDRRFDLLTGGPRDVPSRQQTLNGAIAWSYDLLSSSERTAFRRISVCVGGATLDAAGAILGGGETTLLETLQTLMDASLVRRVDDAGEPRTVMLESIREFGLERLREHDEEQDVRAAHREYFASFAARWGAELGGEWQQRAIDALDRERDNLRLALDDASKHDHDGTLARTVLALWRVWLVRGRWTEGREWIGRALRGSALESPIRAELLAADATMAQNQGDYATAYSSDERALRVWREAGDCAGEARTLAGMGWVAWRLCRYGEARALSEESLAQHRLLGDERGMAQALNNLGWISLFQGDYAAAEETLRRCLDIRRRLGDRRNVAFTMTTLAWTMSRMSDIEDARSLLEQARRLFTELGERQLLAYNRSVAAEIDAREGNAADAAHSLEEFSVPVFREIGDRFGLCIALAVLGDALLLDGRPEKAAHAHDESFEIACAIGDKVWMAAGHAHRVIAAVRRSDLALASTMADAVDALLAEVGGPLPGALDAAYREAASQARQRRPT